MNKPQIIQAFEGDSITIKVAVFDDLSAPFDINGFRGILAVRDIFGEVIGEAVGLNMLQFFLPLNESKYGEYPFVIRIHHDDHMQRYTIAHGKLIIVKNGV